MQEKRIIKPLVLRCLGLCLCVIPVTAAILLYFPIWAAEGGEYILSGITLILLLLAAIPMYKSLTQRLHSPASYVIWLVVFLLFLSLSRIADEMTVISFVGFVTNLIGSLFFKWAEGIEKKNED